MSLAALSKQYSEAASSLRQVIEDFIREVSAHVKRTKDLLDKRGARYDQLGEEIVAAIWAADPNGEDGNGQFEDLNAASQAALRAIEESSRPGDDDVQGVAAAIEDLKRVLRQWSKESGKRLLRIDAAARAGGG